MLVNVIVSEDRRCEFDVARLRVLYGKRGGQAECRWGAEAHHQRFHNPLLPIKHRRVSTSMLFCRAHLAI